MSLTTTVLKQSMDDYRPLLERLNRVNPRSGVVGDETVITPASVPESKTPDVITRPNGDIYLPRKISAAGSEVLDVDMVKRARDSKMPVLLFGVPGTGKTAMAEAAFGEDLITLQGSGETEVADFVGSWTQQEDGNFAWVDGPLLRSMEFGKPFLIDEIALIDPQVMAVVYGVMDGRGEIVVTANPKRGVVKAIEGFYVLGACNPNVPGAMMSDALLSRFTIHVQVDTDWTLTKRLGIPKPIVTIAKNLHTKQANGLILAAPQLRELLAFKSVAETFGEPFAYSNFVSQARETDRSIYIDVIESVSGTKPDLLSVGLNNKKGV